LPRGAARPDARIDEVGYLMRTTAVYGSGKFGAADHNAMAGRPLMDGPFRVEMLTVWLIRAFVADLVEHMAKAEGGGRAVRLDPAIRRALGDRQRHRPRHGAVPRQPPRSPEQLDRRARDGARPGARAAAGPAAERRCFAAALAMAQGAAAGWRSTDPLCNPGMGPIFADLVRLGDHVGRGAGRAAALGRALRWSEAELSLEGQEICAALISSPMARWSTTWPRPWAPTRWRFPHRRQHAAVGALSRSCATGSAGRWPPICRRRGAGAVLVRLRGQAGTAPRRTREEPGAQLEQPLDIARAAAALLRMTCRRRTPEMTVADFLMSRPGASPDRAPGAGLRRAPYREIRDNLLAAEMRPVDMLRCKLAFFGATNFDPRSDRWLRITMYRGAPYPDELHDVRRGRLAAPWPREPAEAAE
jgi:hypothetical protein